MSNSPLRHKPNILSTPEEFIEHYPKPVVTPLYSGRPETNHVFSGQSGIYRRVIKHPLSKVVKSGISDLYQSLKEANKTFKEAIISSEGKETPTHKISLIAGSTTFFD